MNLILIVTTYILCGILCYGLYFAFAQKEFPSLANNDYEIDRFIALITSFSGPVGLVGFIIGTLVFDGNPFKHGLMFKRNKNGNNAGR